MKYVLIWYLHTINGVATGAVDFNHVGECIFAKTQLEAQWAKVGMSVKALCFPKGKEGEVHPDNNLPSPRQPSPGMEIDGQRGPMRFGIIQN